MNILDYVNLFAVGTSEGVRKSWDSRARGTKLHTEEILLNNGYKRQSSYGAAPGYEVGTHIWKNPKHMDDQVAVGNDFWEYTRNDGSVHQGGVHEQNHDLEDVLRERMYDQIPQRAMHHPSTQFVDTFMPYQGD